MLKHKIILVDDDESILDVISIILEDQGLEVIPISQGNRVMAAVKRTAPAVILLDLSIAGSDGRNIFKILKEDPQTEKIPVVIISARGDAHSWARQLGAQGFIPKPFEIEELIQTVQKLCPIAS
jgi:CheY-like chemotaxis protein